MKMNAGVKNVSNSNTGSNKTRPVGGGIMSGLDDLEDLWDQFYIKALKWIINISI